MSLDIDVQAWGLEEIEKQDKTDLLYRNQVCMHWWLGKSVRLGIVYHQEISNLTCEHTRHIECQSHALGPLRNQKFWRVIYDSLPTPVISKSSMNPWQTVAFPAESIRWREKELVLSKKVRCLWFEKLWGNRGLRASQVETTNGAERSMDNRQRGCHAESSVDSNNRSSQHWN